MPQKRARIAFALLLIAIAVSCRDNLTTSPPRSMAPTDSSRRTSTPLDPCYIQVGVNQHVTDNNPSGISCNSWDMHVPWINCCSTNTNGFYWPDTSHFVTSGFAGDIQNGPLVVNFLLPIHSATIELRDGLTFQLPGPAGLRIAAVNAYRDTVALVVSDGVASDFTVAGPDIMQLIIYPKKTGAQTPLGDDYVLRAEYQIEIENAPCPTRNPISDDPTVRKFLKAQLDTAILNGRVERAGGIWQANGEIPPRYIPLVTTLPGATQCMNSFNIPTMAGYTLRAIWHVHAMVPGSRWTNCPTSKGVDYGPGKWPSDSDYVAQEKKGVPEFILDQDDIYRIDNHPDTTRTSRDDNTPSTNHSDCPVFFN